MESRKTPSTEGKKQKDSSKKPRRRAVRRYDRLGMGAHGERALAAMYRRGGVRREELAEELGVSEPVARSTLRILVANKMAKAKAINPWWSRSRGRPPAMWVLEGEGIAYGATLNRVESPKRARREYGRASAHVAHTDLRNGWFFGAARQAERDGAWLPLGSCWGESYPAFPIRADPLPFGRSDDRKDHTYQEPDGTFLLSAAEGIDPTRYLLEVETETSPDEVLGKIDRYCGWLRRLARESDGGRDPFSAPEAGPVLFLFREPRAHVTLQRRVYREAKERSAALPRFVRWDDELGAHGQAAGNFFLFAPLRPAEENGPLDRVFRPLHVYPEDLGGWEVGLGDVAELLRRERQAFGKETV